MVDWRAYKITSKSVSSNYILFHLDNYVNYSNSSNNYKHIYCSNNSPFCDWRDGDFIEIDNDVSRNRNSGYYFSSLCEVRINCRYVCGHSHKEYDDMRDKYNSLERERNDLRTDRNNWRKKYDELKDQLNNEKIKSANEMANEKLKSTSTQLTLVNEKKLIEGKLENSETEKESLLKQIEDGKKELSLVRVEKNKQLALKDGRLKELEEAMETLRVGSEKAVSQKDNSLQEASGELKRKEQEIKVLQSEGFRAKEQLLIERLNLEKGSLEVFASNLKVNLEEVDNLAKNYQRLLFARKERNRSTVEDSEREIAKIKQTLLNSEIDIEDIQKISRNCDELARLSWELEQAQQQYEARQEVPTK